MENRKFLLISMVIAIATTVTFLRFTSTTDKSATANTSVPQARVESPSMATTSTPAAGSVNTESETVPTTATTPINSEGNVFDCLNTSRSYEAGGLKIVSVNLRGKPHYPQIAGPRTRQERKFNSDVRKLAGAGGDEGYGFSVSYATPEFVSVTLWYEFCGASCHVSITPINFDLKTGKRINKLASLFKPEANYLKAISSYCVGEFRRCQWGEEDDWFKKGTKAIAANYEIWSLTRDGIEITFREYQIGPGVIPDTSVVVPYSHLKGMLRQDVNWFRRLRE